MNTKNERNYCFVNVLATVSLLVLFQISLAKADDTLPEPPPVTGDGVDWKSVAKSNIARNILEANANTVDYVASRCEKDSLSREQAVERAAWIQRCLPGKKWETVRKLVEQKSKDGRPQYATFGMKDDEGHISNPKNYIAPKDRGDDCEDNMPPEGYHAVAVCVGGCWVPGQRLAFPDGYKDISQAKVETESSVTTLTPDSTLENPRYKKTIVESYVASLEDTNHDIYEIKTASGTTLKVTPNHPVLLEAGVMITADSVKIDDRILLSDGRSDAISSIQVVPFFGKVYNLRLNTDDLRENIVVAEGVLNGTSFYQNEGVAFLNMELFRDNIPDGLL